MHILLDNVVVTKYQDVHLSSATTGLLSATACPLTTATESAAELPPTGSLRCSSCITQHTSNLSLTHRFLLIVINSLFFHRNMAHSLSAINNDNNNADQFPITWENPRKLPRSTDLLQLWNVILNLHFNVNFSSRSSYFSLYSVNFCVVIPVAVQLNLSIVVDWLKYRRSSV